MRRFGAWLRTKNGLYYMLTLIMLVLFLPFARSADSIFAEVVLGGLFAVALILAYFVASYLTRERL